MSKHSQQTINEQVIRRINNVNGQLSGIVRMIERGDDCVSVLVQFKAAKSGIGRALSLFLKENMKQCVGAEKMSEKKEKDLEKMLDELAK